MGWRGGGETRADADDDSGDDGGKGRDRCRWDDRGGLAAAVAVVGGRQSPPPTYDCQPQTVPNELPVVIDQPMPTPEDRASTSEGKSSQRRFESSRKFEIIPLSWPSWVGTIPENEFEVSSKYCVKAVNMPSCVGITEAREFPYKKP